MVIDSEEVVPLVATDACLVRLHCDGLSWNLWVSGSVVPLEVN